jgi:protoporphyrinogen/coproporphyrinogen III oxidase
VQHQEQAVVIGAGISGLACAFRLKQLGIHPLVLERTERPGGMIASIHKNGFLFESGPQCPRFPAPAWKLLRELRLEDEFIAGPARPKRYIFWRGKLHPAPFSPLTMITTQLVGTGAKLRILADAFGSSRPPQGEETLAEFVKRKFGSEVLDHLVDPIVAAVFLSDPHEMGMESALPAFVEFERRHKSILRGAIRARGARKRAAAAATDRPVRHQNSFTVTDALPPPGSFRTGMATLPRRLAELLGERIRYRAEILSLASAQGNGAGWQVQLADGETILAGHLILAVPAHEAARLLCGHPQVASRLTGIRYRPGYTIGLAYDLRQVEHRLDGFGFMVPRLEGLNTFCTFWNSSLFPDRAPADKLVLTSFARSSDPGPCDLEVLARSIEAENGRVLGISGAPLERVIWSSARAMPEYGVGHAKRIAEIQKDLRSIRHLHLIGNYLSGRSIGDCIAIAESTAKAIAAAVANPPVAEALCPS